MGSAHKVKHPTPIRVDEIAVIMNAFNPLAIPLGKPVPGFKFL